MNVSLVREQTVDACSQPQPAGNYAAWKLTLLILHSTRKAGPRQKNCTSISNSTADTLSTDKQLSMHEPMVREPARSLLRHASLQVAKSTANSNFSYINYDAQLASSVRIFR